MILEGSDRSPAWSSWQRSQRVERSTSGLNIVTSYRRLTVKMLGVLSSAAEEAARHFPTIDTEGGNQLLLIGKVSSVG